VHIEKCSGLSDSPFTQCVTKEVLKQAVQIQHFLAREKKSAFVLVAFTPALEGYRGVTTIVSPGGVVWTGVKLNPIRPDGKGAEFSLSSAVPSCAYFLDTDLRVGESRESPLLPGRFKAYTFDGENGPVSWWGYGVLAAGG